MIEGIKLAFTGAELVAHCKNRAAYHAGRVELYAKRLKDLKALGPLDVEPVNAMEVAEYSNSKQALANAGSRLEQHQFLANKFKVVAGHLGIDSHYSLTMNDLNTLELTD